MIKTKEMVSEISWFSDLSGGDTEYLGVKNYEEAAKFEHLLNILKRADKHKFSAALLPTAYDIGMNPLAFACAAQTQTEQIKTIVALRMGEIYPTTLLRMLSTLDQVSKGRFLINAISSDFPGQKTSAELRYGKTEELLTIMIQAWEKDFISFQGKHYNIELDAAPAKCQYNKRPLIYFGGISKEAKEVAAKYADVYLMWPEKIETMAATIKEVSDMAAKHDREIDFGLRIHAVVRETEKEALNYTKILTSKLDYEVANAQRSKHQNSVSLGVAKQDELRKNADSKGFIEPLVWSTVGVAYSGCGSALVGGYKDVIDKIYDYMNIGMRSFIFSGFPLLKECDYFGKLVLPKLPNISLTDLYKQNVGV